MKRPTQGIAVDCAHSELNKLTEYRGVDLSTGEVIFHEQIGYQTVNIGEYLAVIHAVKHILKKNYDCKTVYTDSQTAITWFTNKSTASKKKYLPLQKAEIFQKVFACEVDSVEVMHWDNRKWGEIPADFGRK